ncbi:MAG: hypothetical protein VXW32_10185 [Myxococcota bacterium]|nr:hypothetical protein [Myxococcota bacterium]
MNNKMKLATAAMVASVGTLSMDAEAKLFWSEYNHPDLEWFTIETEHFNVHYAVSKESKEEGNSHYFTTEWSARKTAAVAEEMWQPMCEEFNYFLKERVDIVMLNHTDYLQGFTIPSWDIIEISANPGGYFYRMRGRMEWFSDVLVHEFAHVVSLKANTPFGEGTGGIEIGGLYSNGILNTDAGVSFSLMDSDPFWWAEGGAEYWSEETGYNWWTAARDHNIRMTFLEDRQLTYEEWVTRIGKSGFDGERGYQQGYSFALYLRERFGPQTFADFAIESGKKWRLNWDDVVEEVTGVDAETLYNDWSAYLMERYTALRDRIKEEGEHLGSEMLPARPDWDYRDPAGRDKWLGKRLRDRESAKEATGVFNYYPHYNEDGTLVGSNNRGALTISEYPESHWYPFGGHYSSDADVQQTARENSVSLPMEFGHGWDFVPGRRAVVVTGNENGMRPMWQRRTRITTNWDGYDWKNIMVIDIDEYARDEDGREYTSFTPERVGRTRRWNDSAFQIIPNTERGMEPAASPDGQKVAYFEYTDGTTNLVTINLDGSEKKHLTTFADGTWMQQVDWSPDGSQLVFTMFRNFHNDLWVINADGTGLRPLTWDGWEEFDAHWGNDGMIYFSADVGQVFNIYRMDPETGETEKLTNVYGGAMSPHLTPDGNLLYQYYTAHGYKNYGLHKSEFMNQDASDHFNTSPRASEVEEFLGHSEDLTRYAEVTVPYSPWASLIAPSVSPSLRFNNDSLTNWGLQAGATFLLIDFAEEHLFYGDAMFGEDVDLVGQYLFQKWRPNISLMARHIESKYDYGIALDEDDDPTTTDDQTVIEGKNYQAANVGMIAMDYSIGALGLRTGLGGITYGFKGADDIAVNPYMNKAYGFLAAFYSTVSQYYYNHPNPRSGRSLDFIYTHGWTDLVYDAYGGVDVDDGELLDAYNFNSFEFTYTEFFPVPDLLNKWRKKPQGDPTLQMNLQLGWIDRNVQTNDEFRAGGRHPYFWGPGSINPNTQFAGYPGGALSGETMAILNMAYRFPIATRLSRKMGPAFINDIYGQFFATAGNLWSYRPPSEPGSYYTNAFDERVARNPDDIVREVPFVDKAYKNAPASEDGAAYPEADNFTDTLLYDAGFELRVSAALFNNRYWNSFARVAYGFNEVRGLSDVDGDDIIDNTSSTVGDSLSNETEPAGVRVYVGIGTSW